MKISVIIPVYNVEKYLVACVNSVIDQTYNNLEIILVNDGSKDDSPDICEQLKKIDSRIRVLHKENGGLASARNYGLAFATGTYVGFIDSDDWIEPDYYEILMNGIKSNDADISVVKFIKCNVFEDIMFTTESKDNWQEYDKYSALIEYYRGNDIGYSAVNKLYKLELFKEIRYPEGKLMEDMATTYKLIDQCDKLVVNNSTKYHYFIRQDSIMRSNFNHRNFDSIEIYDEILLYFEDKDHHFNRFLRGRYTYEITRLIFKMMQSNHNDYRDYKLCKTILRENWKYIFSADKLKRKVQILSLLYLILPTSIIIKSSNLFENVLKKIKLS